MSGLKLALGSRHIGSLANSVAYPGCFFGCPETPHPGHDFFQSGARHPCWHRSSVAPLKFATFGNPLETNSGISIAVGEPTCRVSSKLALGS